MPTIKCLTLWQPWASLIMVLGKPLEFRSWSYLVRPTGVRPGDTIGIHSSVRPIRPREVEDLLLRLDDETCSTGLNADLARPLLLNLMKAPKCGGVLEMGALLGTATIGEPVPTEKIMPKWASFINDSDRLEHCKWAWPMSSPRRFEEPVYLPGRQQFWNYNLPEAK